MTRDAATLADHLRARRDEIVRRVHQRDSGARGPSGHPHHFSWEDYDSVCATLDRLIRALEGSAGSEAVIGAALAPSPAAVQATDSQSAIRLIRDLQEEVTDALESLLAAHPEISDASARQYRETVSAFMLAEAARRVAPVADSPAVNGASVRSNRDEANRRIVNIFESIGDAFFALDREGRFVYLNSQAERLLQRSRHEMMGRSVWEAFPEARGSRLEAQFLRSVRDGIDVRFTEYYAPLDTWFEVHAYPSPEGLSVYFDDVSDQKQAQRALAESEARYRSLVLASAQIVWTTTPDGRVDDMPDWRELTGQTPEQVRGWGWLDAVHPDDRERTSQVWFHAVSSGAEYETEFRVRRHDGAYRLMLSRGVPVVEEDGSAREWVGTCTDITDRRAAEEDVRRRTRQLEVLSRTSQQINAVLEVPVIMRTLVEAAMDLCDARAGLAGHCEEGRLVFREFVVDGETHPLDLTLEAGQGVGGRILDHCAPCVVNDAGEVARRLPPPLQPYGLENAAAVPIVDRDGRLLGCLEVFGKSGGHPFVERDIAMLQGLAASAATALENAHLLAERRRAEEALKEADRAKDRFLALLSHELRNPVASILNSAYLLQQVGPEEPRLARARDTIERAASTQARLLEDLLDVSRITQGKVVLKCQPMRLDQVAGSIARSLAPQAEAKGLYLRSRPRGRVWVNADPTRLDQIISNLILNAVRYTRTGGVEVSVSRAGGEAVLTVTDTGVGIAPEMLPSIFDMFSQEDTSLVHSAGGLGLGLSLVRSYTEMHGGSVDAASEGPGHGTTFTVRLPLSAPAKPSETTPAPHEQERTTCRVLLVDDNEDARETLRDILELDGYTILEAGDGLAGVEIAIREHPDVILLDIGLPNLDGYQVAGRLRALPEFANVRIVAVTGYGQASDRERALQNGFDAHLTKPVDISTLRDLLGTLC